MHKHAHPSVNNTYVHTLCGHACVHNAHTSASSPVHAHITLSPQPVTARRLCCTPSGCWGGGYVKYPPAPPHSLLLRKARTQAELGPERLRGAIRRDPGWVRQEPEPPALELPPVLLRDIPGHPPVACSAQLRDQAGQAMPDPQQQSGGVSAVEPEARGPLGLWCSLLSPPGRWPTPARLSLASWNAWSRDPRNRLPWARCSFQPVA